MVKNENLYKARLAKNDEFYTQLDDIEQELQHYKKHFQNKVVLCNCDDPKKSNFYKFFIMNFNDYGLKKLICTCYKNDNEQNITKGVSKKALVLICSDANSPIEKKNLKTNGDFRSDECLEYLKEADIVVTNPPFTLFREYVKLLMDYDKKFLIIGNKNSITYKEIFPLIKNNKMWLGYNGVRKFQQPDQSFRYFGNVGWFTNLNIDKENNELVMTRIYEGHEKEYPKFKDSDAINIDKVADIPKDYDGIMGVPITFLEKYNPNQFQIVGMFWNGGKSPWDLGRPLVNDKERYKRLAIKRIH